MGCNASKNKVHIVGAVAPSTPQKPSIQVSSKTKKSNSAKRRSQMGSQGSLGGDSITSENRQGSASSKISKHTMDSGFDDAEYQHVITENSDQDKVRGIEESFDTPRDLDFGITGKPIGQRLSAKDKDRFESQRILAALHEEGLIQKPMARASAGVSFEVVQDMPEMFGAIRPPARLAKLEKRRKKKKKVLTQEQIEAKLARAEERRKEKENERLERVKEVSYKSDVQNALDSFQQNQEIIEEKAKTKEEQVAENREKRLREKRDKLKAQQERVEAVKRRKQLQLEEDETPRGVDADEQAAAFGIGQKSRITEDTPIAAVSARGEYSYSDYVTQ